MSQGKFKYLIVILGQNRYTVRWRDKFKPFMWNYIDEEFGTIEEVQCHIDMLRGDVEEDD